MESLSVNGTSKIGDLWRKMIKTAHKLAGGEKDIAVYLIANENAVPFYKKLGMKFSDDVMQYNHIEWTEWTVE